MLSAALAVLASVFVKVDEDGTGRITFGGGSLAPLDEDAVIDAWRKGSNNPDENVVLIDQVPFEDMTHELFFGTYQARRIPVVLTGAYAGSPLLSDELYGWQALHDRFGHVVFPTRIPRASSKKSCTGTGLCVGPNITLGELLEAHFLNDDTEEDGDGKKEKKAVDVNKIPYPHDESLEKMLPEMYEDYKTLSYFGENLLLAAKNGKDRWPSIFFGARGTQTGLHVDSMGTSFTMAVFRGRKQFILLDAKEGLKLCMDTPLPFLDYGIEAFKPNFDRCPAARNAKAMFASIGPSDILFMPGSYHHAAWNVEDSIGVSQNFLSVNDYDSIMESFVGYAQDVKREMKRRRGGEKEQIKVSFGFLAMRDFFRFLAETGYLSNWRDGPTYWKPKDATNESFKRIATHMYQVLLKDKDQAWRPAYFCSPKLAQIALKFSDAYSCLPAEIRNRLEGEDLPDDVSRVLEPAFLNGGDCQHFEHSWNRLMDTVTNAAPLLEHEKALTKDVTWSFAM